MFRILPLGLLLLGGPACLSPNHCADRLYPEREDSPYVLPYAVETAHVVIRGNCEGVHNEGDWFAYDFAMDVGTPVLAARDGMVTVVVEESASNEDGLSNFVEVTHLDDTRAQYHHLTVGGARVEEDADVERGAVLGLSGHSAVAGEAPNLHFVVLEPDESGERVTLPVTFQNTDAHPNGLQTGRKYEAYAY